MALSKTHSPLMVELLHNLEIPDNRPITCAEVGQLGAFLRQLVSATHTTLDSKWPVQGTTSLD